LIKIYEVQIKYDLDDENKRIAIRDNIDQFPEFEGVNIDELNSEQLPYFPSLETTFHVGEYNLFNATVIAQEESIAMFPDGVELISIKEIEEMNILNWPEEDCPYCAAEDCAPEDIVEFTCSCGKQQTVADGWKFLECRDCGKVIDRNHIIGSNGKYILIETGENKTN
jgi:hypothetical protein